MFWQSFSLRAAARPSRASFARPSDRLVSLVRLGGRYGQFGLGDGTYPEINFATEIMPLTCESRDPGLGSRWRELTCAVRDWWQRSSIVASDAARRWRQASRR